jgi:oligoendopeptidase F
MIAGRPFIFMNAVGLHDDVHTLLHEGGHAFHTFEMAKLPYAQQTQVGMEFIEVASITMELLGSPYLAQGGDGFYTPQEAARARTEHLITMLRFWPYMAVVDGFQHWVYEHPRLAANSANCDAVWSELVDIYMPGIDWTGLEEYKALGWHIKDHITQVPFYYVEYGLALLGATQVWSNSFNDQAAAVRSYRHALSLGFTVSVPDFYQAAGARFAMDAGTLGGAVSLLEQRIEELEQQL